MVQEERRILNVLLEGVVACKLKNWQQCVPVILPGIDKMPQHVLQHPVHSLSLTIALQMIGS